MKLVLIRHGMTEWNLQKRVQGRIDQSLSEAGRAQLKDLVLPDWLQHYRWYCSPLQRAVQTAQLLGVNEYQLDRRLIEMSWGEWEGQILKPLRKQLGDVMRDNESRGLDFCPPNGESPRQVQQRIGEWLAEVCSEGPDCAVIAHKGIIRCVYALALGWDMVGDSPVDFAWDAAHLFECSTDGQLAEFYESVPLGDA